MKRALLIGSNGTIGRALARLMEERYQLTQLNQEVTDYSQGSLETIANALKADGGLDIVVCCIGTLHNSTVSPEKRLRALDADKLAEYFRINAILPAMCLRAFTPVLKKDVDAKFSVLSAMVGSIGDNQLGGWYGYRSSKAALNMLIKTASIEVARTHKRAALAVIHPGTTIGPLSKPFSSGVSEDKYYTAEQTAERVLAVTENLDATKSGAFLNWDGTTLPW